MLQPHVYLQTQIPEFITSSIGMSATFLILPFSKGFCAAKPKGEKLLITIDLKKALNVKFYASSAAETTTLDNKASVRIESQTSVTELYLPSKLSMNH